MSSIQTRVLTNFVTLLSAPARSPEIPESEDVYGWLVGSWELDVLRYRAVDLSREKIRAEAHFGWVLEGRAVQDVWIMPSPSSRNSSLDRANNMYGTTLRIWDPNIRAWRIRWINPVSGHEERQTGRRVGDEIVQIGARPDGTPTRWRFTEITPDSFHWIGEDLMARAANWKENSERADAVKGRAKSVDTANESDCLRVCRRAAHGPERSSLHCEANGCAGPNELARMVKEPVSPKRWTFRDRMRSIDRS